MSSSALRSRTLRRIAVPLAATAVALGVAAATATPAAASNSYNGNAYISGSDTPADDLNDEGAVNMSTNTVSSVTCFWQNILYLDGYLSKSGIDGSFGPATKTATAQWQGDRGLSADGSAGKATFTEAGIAFGSNWHWTENTSGGRYWVGYRPSHVPVESALEVTRPFDGGAWSFLNKRTGKWVTAAYNTNAC
ncbi:peptidoglycan-binding protein [Streptomyces sp. NPDC020983]|uniref:peptidoglycan-binding protein n=1 Tax=Streptomyces sp. NPDC020983 TaxID=3365106 RepID=UPI0037A01338